jgi:hypothetical protein
MVVMTLLDRRIRPPTVTLSALGERFRRCSSV